jgi:diacylglycerol kinase (ATP)
MKFQRDNSFFTGRLKSIGFAFKGAAKLITTEHSIIVQSCIALVLVIAGFVCNISRIEWMIQTLCIGLVLGVEGLNTAVEKIADFIHPDFHKKIGFIKDIAAGAVLFVAMTALAVLLMIYVPILL